MMNNRIRRAAAITVMLGSAVEVSAFSVARNTAASLTSSFPLSAMPRNTMTDTADSRSVTSADDLLITERRRRMIEYNDAVFADGTDEEIDDEFHRREVDENSEFLSSMNVFQELQRSTGSEILDYELQRQIDKASSTSPRAFLDDHVADATLLEKIAMASVPEQLPRPAVSALSRKSKDSQDKKEMERSNSLSKREQTRRQKQRSLNFDPTRVTHEQELQLGRLIQRGVELHGMRTKFEKANDRTITRQEWTNLAGLNSPSELRREVSNYRRAKQLLVSANMGLVHAIVRPQFNSGQTAGFGKSGLTYDELVQEGSLGLIRAAELFDPNKGLRFSTYATIWIKGMLSNSEIEGTIRLPRREKDKWNRISKTHNDLVKEKGGVGEPTVEELANHLGMNVADVVATKRKMSQAQHVLSLDYEYKKQSRSGIDTGSLSDLELDEAFQVDADLAERTQMQADLVAALACNLDAREARLMRLQYGLTDGRARSLTECGEAMGISQSAASRLAKKCLEKLREAEDADSLEEYLLTIA